MEIRFAVSALDDLADIRHYYTLQGVPDVGERFVLALIERIEHLAEHPDIGRVVPEFETPNLRELREPLKIASLQFLESPSKRRDFCLAPFFKHLKPCLKNVRASCPHGNLYF